MFFSYYIISYTRFFHPGKPRNKKLASRNKSKRRNILPLRRKKMVPVDTVIQEITDEDGMLEDITIESASIVESLGSGDSGETVVAI